MGGGGGGGGGGDDVNVITFIGPDETLHKRLLRKRAGVGGKFPFPRLSVWQLANQEGAK